MSLTMLGDLAVSWLYVTLICSFLHYITLHKGWPRPVAHRIRCGSLGEWVYNADFIGPQPDTSWSCKTMDRAQSWHGM